MKKSVVVKMQQDFEARPIANLVQVANRYESKIYLEHGDSRVNAKSIMGKMCIRDSYCEVDMDEDDAARLMQGHYRECPYYQLDDEYAVVRHQM